MAATPAGVVESNAAADVVGVVGFAEAAAAAWTAAAAICAAVCPVLELPAPEVMPVSEYCPVERLGSRTLSLVSHSSDATRGSLAIGFL